MYSVYIFKNSLLKTMPANIVQVFFVLSSFQMTPFASFVTITSDNPVSHSIITFTIYLIELHEVPEVSWHKRRATVGRNAFFTRLSKKKKSKSQQREQRKTSINAN